MTGLRFESGDFNYSATLSTPTFGAFGKWVELSKIFCERLAPFGANVDSLAYENATNHPKDFALACYFFGGPSGSGGARVKIKTVEAWGLSGALVGDPGLRLSLVETVFAALTELATNTNLDAQTVTLTGHAELAEGTFAGRVAQYVTATPEKMAVSGIGFRKDLGPAGQGFIDLQPSYQLVRETSMFVRTTLRASGNLSPKEAHQAGTDLFETALRELGLEPDWSRVT